MYNRDLTPRFACMTEQWQVAGWLHNSLCMGKLLVYDIHSIAIAALVDKRKIYIQYFHRVVATSGLFSLHSIIKGGGEIKHKNLNTVHVQSLEFFSLYCSIYIPITYI